MDEELKDVKFVKPDFLVESKSKKTIFLSLKVSKEKGGNRQIGNR